MFPSISFAADISSIQKEMPEWAQQRIPSITRNALNDTAEDMVSAELAKISGVFDRPTPFTAERAVEFPRNQRATRDRLEAVINVRDGAGVTPEKYLKAEIEGGPRAPKRFELALRAKGLMAIDEFATLAIGFKRDAYGNLPGSTVVSILSQLQAFSEMGFKANESARSKKRNIRAGKARYFVPKEGSGLRRGVYERVGNRISAVVIFVRQPIYRKRFDFGQASVAKAERVFGAYWERHFYRELAKANGGSS